MRETNPELSVVAVIVSDTVEARPSAELLRGTLTALAAQRRAPSMEVIVPYCPGVKGMEAVRRDFHSVRFLEVRDLALHRPGSREHHDELRARGLALARGAIVGLLEDHGAPDPDWAARVVEAHRSDFAAVGGAIENGIDRPLNWAVCFCDFLRYQNPLPAGESEFASDANVSYKRDALEAIRPVWERVFHETRVNAALRAAGWKIALAPGVVVRQQRRGLRLGSALAERYIWGRSYASTRGTMAGLGRRLFWASFAPLLPALLLARMAAATRRKGRNTGPFLRALPLTSMLLVAWSWGELAGYLTGRASGAANAGSAQTATA